MFNFNIRMDSNAPRQATHIIGPCEELLPQLVAAVKAGSIDTSARTDQTAVGVEMRLLSLGLDKL